MTLHLAEVSAAVAPGAHAVLLLDQAGWHLSDRLEAPSNITLIPLPPKCPGCTTLLSHLGQNRNKQHLVFNRNPCHLALYPLTLAFENWSLVSHPLKASTPRLEPRRFHLHSTILQVMELQA